MPVPVPPPVTAVDTRNKLSEDELKQLLAELHLDEDALKDVWSVFRKRCPILADFAHGHDDIELLKCVHEITTLMGNIAIYYHAFRQCGKISGGQGAAEKQLNVTSATLYNRFEECGITPGELRAAAKADDVNRLLVNNMVLKPLAKRLAAECGHAGIVGLKWPVIRKKREQ